MKFLYVGPNRIDELGKEWPANCYDGQSALNGEEVEFEGHFADKAKANPHYTVKKQTRKKAADKPATENLLD
jgi:hypothetical protein